MKNQPTGDLKAILESEVSHHDDRDRITSREVSEHPEPEAVSSEPAKAKRCPAREGKIIVSGFVDPDAHYQLKLLSLEAKTSIQALVVEGLNLVFKLHDKPPIA